ncbi:MAG TPA: hypothetical protein PK448_01350, partial [Bacteroidales bacterium]|nr:hypothetical protein [Bacteroidales bacterium]
MPILYRFITIFKQHTIILYILFKKLLGKSVFKFSIFIFNFLIFNFYQGVPPRYARGRSSV